MAILIDPPQWPAHGTLWSHLVSDSSYDELHDFASRMPLPRRSFDLDHYDVPAAVYEHALTLGALPVGGKDLVHRLRNSGLRVRQVERDTQIPVRRRQYLDAEWAELAGLAGVDQSTRARDDWSRLGAGLLAQWNESHRSYHDERHLEDVLLALDHLAVRGERLAPATLLAAWFHDARYSGSAGSDELESAQLATAALAAFDLAPGLVYQVGELIVATTPAHSIERPSAPLSHLLDADLAIFAASQQRYDEYTVAVRAEYAHVPSAEFQTGRAQILGSYLKRSRIYFSDPAHNLWEERARANLTREIGTLRG